MQGGVKYAIKHLSKTTRCIVPQIKSMVDLNTLLPVAPKTTLHLNEIARVAIKTMHPIAFDSYERNRTSGGFILIDEATNATVAAGMICS